MSDRICVRCRRADARAGEPGRCAECGGELIPFAVLAESISPEVDSEDPPERMGRYHLEERIAQGGMGIVWRAFDPDLGRRVALKVLRPDRPDQLSRLLREAQISARLRHPNIVPIHDVGTARGNRFVAMEWVEGRSLEDSRFPVRRAAEIALEAARAVDYAHQQGVIHRDIKPENLILDAHGRLFLTDFGMAKEVDLRSSLSTTGTLMGTPSFMSPEQASGNAKDADVRTDVWGLGATLYALLTGRAPFEGATLYETADKVLHADPPPPRRLDPSLPKSLETIVLKCLEKDPGRRYAGARDLAEDLTRFLAGEIVAARPASALYRLRRRLAKRKAIALAAVVVVLTAGVALALWRRGRAEAGDRRERGTALVREADLRFARNDFVRAKSLYDEARGLGVPVPPDRYRRCVERQRSLEARARREERWGPRVRRAELALRKARQARRAIRPSRSEWYGFIEEAVRTMDEVLREDPTWPTGYIVRGRAKEEGDDLDGAIEDFTRALRRAPEDSLARYERGKAYLRRMNEATLFQGSDAHASRDLEVWGRKARADLSFGGEHGWKLEEAELALLGLYRLCADGKWGAVLDRCDTLIRERPGEIRLLRIRGMALGWLGRYRDAERAYTTAIEAGDITSFTYLLRAKVRSVLKEWRGLADDCTRALELAPATPVAYVSRSLARGRLEGWEKAVEDCNTALKIDPEFAPAYGNRGFAYARLDRDSLALADFNRALSLNPDLIPALINRAFLRGRARDWKGQLEDYGRIIRLSPTTPEPWYGRGIAWMRLAEEGPAEKASDPLRAAVRDFEKFLSLAPGHPKAARIRALRDRCRSRLAERGP